MVIWFYARYYTVNEIQELLLDISKRFLQSSLKLNVDIKFCDKLHCEKYAKKVWLKENLENRPSGYFFSAFLKLLLPFYRTIFLLKKKQLIQTKEDLLRISGGNFADLKFSQIFLLLEYLSIEAEVKFTIDDRTDINSVK